MQIVIDIDDNEYHTILNHAEEILDASSFIEPKYLYLAILNGELLPKGHGRLIDADKLVRPEIRPFLYHLKNGDTVIPEIDILHAPTIIEADKGEGE